MLASDLNNPEFVGVTNPDASLHVEFFWHEPIDKWASEEASAAAGRRVIKKMQKQEFIRIMRPGDQLTILEVQVREEHKARFPERYLYWQMAEGLVDGGRDVPGWKIDEWPELDDQSELLRDLKYRRFYTVEQVAGSSDAQVQMLGIGGAGLRERARLALRERMSKEFRADIQAKDAVIASQGDAIAALQKQMAEFMEQATKPQPLKLPEGKRG